MVSRLSSLPTKTVSFHGHHVSTVAEQGYSGGHQRRTWRYNPVSFRERFGAPINPELQTKSWPFAGVVQMLHGSGACVAVFCVAHHLEKPLAGGMAVVCGPSTAAAVLWAMCSCGLAMSGV